MNESQAKPILQEEAQSEPLTCQQYPSQTPLSHSNKKCPPVPYPSESLNKSNPVAQSVPIEFEQENTLLQGQSFKKTSNNATSLLPSQNQSNQPHDEEPANINDMDTLLSESQNDSHKIQLLESQKKESTSSEKECRKSSEKVVINHVQILSDKSERSHSSRKSPLPFSIKELPDENSKSEVRPLDIISEKSFNLLGDTPQRECSKKLKSFSFMDHGSNHQENNQSSIVQECLKSSNHQVRFQDKTPEIAHKARIQHRPPTPFNGKEKIELDLTNAVSDSEMYEFQPRKDQKPQDAPEVAPQNQLPIAQTNKSIVMKGNLQTKDVKGQPANIKEKDHSKKEQSKPILKSQVGLGPNQVKINDRNHKKNGTSVDMAATEKNFTQKPSVPKQNQVKKPEIEKAPKNLRDAIAADKRPQTASVEHQLRTNYNKENSHANINKPNINKNAATKQPLTSRGADTLKRKSDQFKQVQQALKQEKVAPKAKRPETAQPPQKQVVKSKELYQIKACKSGKGVFDCKECLIKNKQDLNIAKNNVVAQQVRV